MLRLVLTVRVDGEVKTVRLTAFIFVPRIYFLKTFNLALSGSGGVGVGVGGGRRRRLVKCRKLHISV